MLIVEPISLEDANAAVRDWHRHNGPVPRVQASFAYALYELVRIPQAGMSHCELIGVAIVGNPSGRPMGADRKLILEVRRVCFKPGVVFHKLRRYYHDRVRPEEMSLRTVPVMIRDLDGYQPFAQGNAIPAWTVPSYFLRCAEFYTQQKYANIKTLWTYALESERGGYIEQAGYVCDHYVKSRGPGHLAKYRYTKSLAQ